MGDTVVLAVGLIVAYPVVMLGVTVVVIAVPIGYTSRDRASEYWVVMGITILGVLVNLGSALVIGVTMYLVLQRRETPWWPKPLCQRVGKLISESWGVIKSATTMRTSRTAPSLAIDRNNVSSQLVIW